MKTTAVVLTEVGGPKPYAASRPLVVEELELDPPGDGEVLVRIAAAGVCHSDLSVVDGSRPRPVPMALGHEAAGVVEQLGPGVDDLAVGDHVVLTFVPSCGSCPDCTGGAPALCADAATANTAGTLLHGGRRLHRGGAHVHHHLGVSAFATHAVVARGSVVPVSKAVPFDVAAMFGCAVLTGVGAVVNTADVLPGETVAVFGLGGVGLTAVMGAVVAGASAIVGIDPIETKRALALELGATAAVTPEDAVAAVRDLVPGGVHAAIETAGRVDAFAAAYGATRRGGITVAVGLPDPSQTFPLSPTALVAEGRRVAGSYMGSSVPQRDIPRLIELWQAGRLPVDRLRSGTIGLGGVNEAMDALAEGSALRQIVDPTLA